MPKIGDENSRVFWVVFEEKQPLSFLILHYVTLNVIVILTVQKGGCQNSFLKNVCTFCTKVFCMSFWYISVVLYVLLHRVWCLISIIFLFWRDFHFLKNKYLCLLFFEITLEKRHFPVWGVPKSIHFYTIFQISVTFLFPIFCVTYVRGKSIHFYF